MEVGGCGGLKVSKGWSREGEGGGAGLRAAGLGTAGVGGRWLAWCWIEGQRERG